MIRTTALGPVAWPLKDSPHVLAPFRGSSMLSISQLTPEAERARQVSSVDITEVACVSSCGARVCTWEI